MEDFLWHVRTNNHFIQLWTSFNGSFIIILCIKWLVIVEQKGVEWIAFWIYVSRLCFCVCNARFCINFIRTKRQYMTRDKLDWEHLNRTWLYGYWLIRLFTQTLEVVFDWCVQNVYPSVEHDFWFFVKFVKPSPIIFRAGVNRMVFKCPIALLVLDIIPSDHSDVLRVIFRQAIWTHRSKSKRLVLFIQVDFKVFVEVACNDICYYIRVSSADQVVGLRDGVAYSHC